MVKGKFRSDDKPSEELTYVEIHAWVKRTWGNAVRCDQCGKTGLSRWQAHWSNKDHKYTRNREDWWMLCRPCHARYDIEVLGRPFGRPKGQTPWNKGVSPSPESVEKMKATKASRGNPQKGKPRSEETRRKCSEARKKAWERIKAQKSLLLV